MKILECVYCFPLHNVRILSHSVVSNSAIPWTAVRKTALSMEFFR